MTKNLQDFWTVQPSSGHYSHIFTSYEAAQSAYEQWNTEVDAEFDKWERGDRNASVLIQSTLEADLEGGCYQSYSAHPACRPSGIDHYSAYSENCDRWRDNPGFNKIRWGNPATARPAR